MAVVFKFNSQTTQSAPYLEQVFRSKMMLIFR
ncbi:hypothetical protein J2045_002662 [Peteryoungia aggregata LMG 23059]|uniref:Uncharacterized protein n=1 Tax=Peteryoungia aggregata LMG 23059 TaxID=1368425 RepID=A0ABU0G8F7_9HYPH|nr:hypothetical protein [Peteryoungia aggregata LMG 23059]